jgi:hypothetical protein
MHAPTPSLYRWKRVSKGLLVFTHFTEYEKSSVVPGLIGCKFSDVKFT